MNTVQEYIRGQAAEPFVILRHDVDRRLQMALEMAQKEKDVQMRRIVLSDRNEGHEFLL